MTYKNDLALRKTKLETTDRLGKRPAGNSTLAIGGVPFSADTFLQAESFVLRINICGEKPAHRKSANRYSQC